MVQRCHEQPSTWAIAALRPAWASETHSRPRPARGPAGREELAPEALGLGLADVQADHFAAAAVVHAVGDRKRLMAHPISESWSRVGCRGSPRGSPPAITSQHFEPPRDSWRLRLVRGWSHDQTREVSAGAAGAGCAHGGRAPGRAPSQWAAICSIATKFGVSHETLRNWVRRAEVDDGQRPGLTSDERQRLKSLERENRELRRANEILKSASAFFAAELDRRGSR
jgi:transposase